MLSSVGSFGNRADWSGQSDQIQLESVGCQRIGHHWIL